MSKFEGDTEDDRKLWQTYVHWAREQIVNFLPPGSDGSQLAIVDDSHNRLPDDIDRALRAILFSAFVLEYRLKRVLTIMGVPPKQKDSLRQLFQGFWKRVSNIDRLDGKGKCTRPLEWRNINKDLEELVNLRDFIAHGRYQEIISFCSRKPIEQHAKEVYLAVIEAIKLINIYTGAEQRPPDEVEKHFMPLTTRPALRSGSSN